jgi:uncharacterized membrane protein YsdA (DUF1294 family)
MELNNEFLKFFLIYYLVINIVGFLSMGLDKFKAKHNHWRIPEKTLLLIPLFLGSVGSLIGMYTFRHKTKHAQFKYGIPAILVINVICIYFIVTKLILVSWKKTGFIFILSSFFTFLHFFWTFYSKNS